MKKLLFVYNAKSGKSLVKKHLADILDVFAKAEYKVSVRPTQSRGDATVYVNQYGYKFDRIVCCGGDGTLNEVITGLLQSDWYEEKKTPLGYIPAGSTNDFANSISLPKNMVSAAEVAVRGQVKELDMGSFNERNFVYVAAFGAFVDVSYATPQELKNVLGHQAYIIEGIKKAGSALTTEHHMKMLANGKKVEGDYIYGMVSNSNSVGGFKGISGKDIGLDDGLFEVTLVKKPHNPADIQDIISGLLFNNKSRMVTRFKTPYIKFLSEKKVDWVVDGEYAGKQRLVKVKNHHGAISAITGDKVFVGRK